MTYTPTTLDDIIGTDSAEEASARHTIEILLEQSKVRQWLESLADRSTVGLAGNGCRCPIANYLSAVSTDPTLSFWIDEYVTTVNQNHYQFICVRHPEWLATFIFRLDCLGSLSEITKESALKILNQIKEGE